MKNIKFGAIILTIMISIITQIHAQTIIKGSLYVDQPNVAALFVAFKTMETLGYDVRATRVVIATRLTPKYITVSFSPATGADRPRILPMGAVGADYFAKVPRMTVFVGRDTLATAGYQIDGDEFVQIR